MTRKLWMTIGTLALLVIAGSAWGTEQDGQVRKDTRKQLCQSRQSERQAGNSRREAKARAWRQIILARMAGSDPWQEAFEDLAAEVLVVATELAQTGNHHAAMHLVQRVLNAIPDEAEVHLTLERICQRGPRTRSEEECEFLEQECEQYTCYELNFGSAVSSWIHCLQEASAPGACKSSANCPVARPTTAPVCVPCAPCAPTPVCCPVAGSCPVAVCCPPVFKPSCCPVMPPVLQVCPPPACTKYLTQPRLRVFVVSSHTEQTGDTEVQEVTLIRTGHDGNRSQRHYQVHRNLGNDQQTVSRTERTAGSAARFVRIVCNDTAGNYVEDYSDIVPCDQ